MTIDATIDATGFTLGASYARLDTGVVFNGSAYEAVTPANFTNYLIAGAATGLVDAGGNEIYHFTRPGGLADVPHVVSIWRQSGGSWALATATLLASGTAEPLVAMPACVVATDDDSTALAASDDDSTALAATDAESTVLAANDAAC